MRSISSLNSYLEYNDHLSIAVAANSISLCGSFLEFSFQNKGCIKLLRTFNLIKFCKFKAPLGIAGNWFPSTFNSLKFLIKKITNKQ